MIRLQDFPPIVSKVVAVAEGPDGRPALLNADKPAGTSAERFTYSGGKVVTIRYYASDYDPDTQTGTLLATKNIRWSGDEVNDIYWT